MSLETTDYAPGTEELVLQCDSAWIFWNVWLTHLGLEMMFREVPETDLAPIFA